MDFCPGPIPPQTWHYVPAKTCMVCEDVNSRAIAMACVREALIDRARKGNRHALAELYERDPLNAALVDRMVRDMREFRVQAWAQMAVRSPREFTLTDVVV